MRYRWNVHEHQWNINEVNEIDEHKWKLRDIYENQRNISGIAMNYQGNIGDVAMKYRWHINEHRRSIDENNEIAKPMKYKCKSMTYRWP